MAALLHAMLRIVVLAVVGVLFPASGQIQAQGSLPAPLAEEIAAAARPAPASAVVAQLGSAPLNREFSQNEQLRTRQRMSTVVIAAIARYPALVEPIVTAALAAAPQAREHVLVAASRAYPAFAARIAAAGGGLALSTVTFEPAIQPVAVATAKPQPAAPVAEQAGRLPESINDPLEGFNRAVFAVNDVIDVFIFRPLAALYGFVTPAPVKASARNIFANVNEPVVFTNQLLQLDLRGAGTTVGRFAINSTVGVAGVFDVADSIGFAPQTVDFGQTLYTYGAGSGPYLVLPLLGPSTLRDGVGVGVDRFFQPLHYIFDTGTNVVITAVDGVITREELIPVIEDLRRTSLDYYAAMRATYYQDRAVELGGGVPPASSEIDTLFDETQ